MKRLLIPLFFICCACSCLPTISSDTKQMKDAVVWMYIYDGISDKPTDSLMAYQSGFEKSLELYNDTAVMDKEVSGLVHFSIFELNGEKFSVIVDTSAVKVFRFVAHQFRKIKNIDCELGVNKVELKKIDFNADGYPDIIIDVPSGGTFGTLAICLFYDPESKSFVYDEEADLRDIELDAKKKTLTSYLNLSTRKYHIESRRFRLIEEKIDLGKTTSDEALRDKYELLKFNHNGRIIARDTI